jgi:hypothetical protein
MFQVIQVMKILIGTHPSEVYCICQWEVLYTQGMMRVKAATSGVALTYPGVEAMYWTATANVLQLMRMLALLIMHMVTAYEN